MTEAPDARDEFAEYFRSDEHNRRMEDATKRTLERLSGIGRGELLAGFSEAIGTVFGVAQYYRTLGLKHQGAKVFREVFHWMKKGTD